MDYSEKRKNFEETLKLKINDNYEYAKYCIVDMLILNNK